MKWSQYNYIFDSPKHGIFIFNSATSSFLKISQQIHEKITSVKNWDEELNTFETTFVKVLINHKIVVDDNHDLNFFYKKKYFRYLASFNPGQIFLTITTTTGCNFKCPYCYEEGVKTQNMAKDVEDAIIKYIETIQKPIDITWYGGEPLMNWGTIERITNRIAELKPVKKVTYSLITNGYSLTPEICSFLTKAGFDHIQITLDGLEETHNKSRLSKNGKPSYKIIMDNIDQALKIMPDTSIYIRVNIGPHNKNEYPALRNEILTKWNNHKNIIPYFSFLHDYSSCNSPSCLSSKEKLNFVTELYNNHAIISRDILIKNKPGICSANLLGSYVIAPDGGLYKCWVDIGKPELMVGTIFEPEKNVNFELLGQYFTSDKFSDERCQKCFLLPLCSGLCPIQRYVFDNKFKMDEICMYNYQEIDTILEMLYEIMQSAKDENSELVKSKKIITIPIKNY